MWAVGTYRLEDNIYGVTRGVTSCRFCCSLVYVSLLYFILGQVQSHVAGAVFSKDELRHTGTVSEVHVKCDRLVAQLSSSRSECSTGCSVARDRADDIDALRGLLGSPRTRINSFRVKLQLSEKN